MQTRKPERLIAMRDVRRALADACSNTIRDHVRRGVLPKPIKLSSGPTAPSVWPEREIEAVVQARVAGKSEDELRVLVAGLEAQRQVAA